MKGVGEDCGMQPVTIAMAFVYFEKLVLQGRLNKQNRYFNVLASYNPTVNHTEYGKCVFLTITSASSALRSLSDGADWCSD